MVAAIDMTYWVADEPVMEGTKEPETMALCFVWRVRACQTMGRCLYAVIIPEMNTPDGTKAPDGTR